MENYIQDYSYGNCFWEKIDFLYKHSKSKYKEFIKIGVFSNNIAEYINKFCKAILLTKNDYQPYKENYVSSRGEAIQKTLDFIEKIIKNLQDFSKNLENISIKIEEKKFSYESKKDAKKMCEEGFKKYENSLKSLSNKRQIYYETVNQAIELHLNSKLKKNKDINHTEKEHLIENIIKKRKEYKDQLNKVEKYRTEYIELQRNIFNTEEEFERDCTNEIKKYLKQIISLYEELLQKGPIKKELIDCIDNIDGTIDNQIFAEKNRSAITCPGRIPYIEYSEDSEYYSNFEVVKNFMKNKSKEDFKEKKNKINKEVKNFLEEIIQTTQNENVMKFEEIANSIVNNNLKEEDFIFLINQFQKSFDDYVKWKESENIGFLDFKKVGEDWDNRFSNMHLYLEAFNKIRMNNKELDQKSFDYFIQAMKKILSFNDNEDIDYKLCQLLITLSATFYTLKIENDNERKIFASEMIKDTPLLQKSGFWVGLTKYELNEEILKEKINNKKSLNKNNSLLNNLNLNINVNIPLLNKKKKEENKEDEEQIDKNVIAKLMTVSYNLIQFIMDSDTLNNILANIFRCFKINKENKEMIIAMVNCHIETEKAYHLKIDEEMLLNCDKVEYFINSKEKIFNNKDHENHNNNIQNFGKKEITYKINIINENENNNSNHNENEDAKINIKKDSNINNKNYIDDINGNINYQINNNNRNA